MAKKKRKEVGTLPESFLFFFFLVCSQASPSAWREFLFTAALHLSQKGLADIQRIPKIKIPYTSHTKAVVLRDFKLMTN